MKVLVLGASGVIGQFLRLAQPSSVTAVYYRREADCLHKGCDLEHWPSVLAMLREEQPDVIVNLAGESRPDVVERDPERYEFVNTIFPELLATHGLWRLIQISTQAVCYGETPNWYGLQKERAEFSIHQTSGTVLRPTFILGARPLPHVGRQNPLEQFAAIGPEGSRQVNDRWFSPCFAEDAAAAIWSEVLEPKAQGVANVGIPVRTCRYELAKHVASGPVEPVSHDNFEGIAPRPLDTTYADEGPYMFRRSVQEGMAAHVQRIRDFEERNMADRAREIALFLGISERTAYERLSRGFGVLHNEVSADFRAVNPQGDNALLDWYRCTESYIWELSAYHCDPGFNTKQQHFGIAEALKAHGCNRVLCLGDGIGELTLALRKAGFSAVYHDLHKSRTEAFANFRYWRHMGRPMASSPTEMFKPDFFWEDPRSKYDAVVSLDFLEHVPNVDEWAAAIRAALKSGGFFVAQNAFNIGSGPAGDMPMHLACNDRYEKDWDPTLIRLGFEQLASQWYRRAA